MEWRSRRRSRTARRQSAAMVVRGRRSPRARAPLLRTFARSAAWPAPAPGDAAQRRPRTACTDPRAAVPGAAPAEQAEDRDLHLLGEQDQHDARRDQLGERAGRDDHPGRELLLVAVLEHRRSDSSPITITVAATTPVAAASIVPTTITAARLPRGDSPSTARSSAATARQRPISRGSRPSVRRTAPRSVWSDNVGNHRDGMRLVALGSNSPVRSPMNEKSNAVPAKQNTTL